MYPVWLWSLLQVALSQPSILARSWWEAAPSEDGRAQTETVSAPRQSARHATSDMPTTTSPKQILRGVSLLILHLVWFNSCLHHFFFFFLLSKETDDVWQECKRAGRACSAAEVQRWYERVLRGFDVSWQASDSNWQSDDLGAQGFLNPQPILAPVV